MKRKWWFILAAAALAIGVFCFRDALMVRLFPKAVLSRSITDSFQQLEQRFENSPLRLVANALDTKGQQRVSIKLDTATQLAGVAHYTMELQTQSGPRRIFGQGTVSTGGGTMDLSVYLDGSCVAVSSEGLTDGQFYGITYDTFHQDIRSFELFSMLAGEQTLNGWEESLMELQELMEMNTQQVELSAQDVQTALLGTLALKPEVEAGEGKAEYHVSFCSPGPALAELAKPYLDQVPEPLEDLIRAMEADEASSLDIVFYLTDRRLTKIQSILTLSDGSWQVTGVLGEDPATGPLTLEVVSRQEDNLDRVELTVETVSDPETYQEKIQLKRTRNGVQEQLSADYSWDLTSGDLVLDLVRQGKKYPIRLNLTGEGDTLTLYSQEAEVIQSALTGKEKTGPAICTLVISPGEPVEPLSGYKNLSDWSAEDLLLLITRLGQLIGIKLA
ncbi:MAG: hypothetical protein E7465_06850 [Ruminococcaceae bacterium]|nr:hypothetical protein [Oscillospiraceae bacterium]